MAKDLVFLSYFEKEWHWAEELKEQLLPLNQQIAVWDRSSIQPGALWKDEIEKAIKQAKVAILLVSAGYLASDEVSTQQLFPILERAEKHGLQIFWVLISACLYEATAINKFTPAWDKNKPLNGLSEPDKNAAMVTIAKKLQRTLQGQPDEGENGSSPAPESGVDEFTQESFLEFDLHINSSGHALARSKEGEASATISLKLPEDMDTYVILIRRGQTNEHLFEKMGRSLFEWLFPNDIRNLLDSTETRARIDQANLRIRLRIESPEIAALPLEFLYRPKTGSFMATNPKTVLSRYLNQSLPQERVRRREGKLHMLVIISMPSDLGQFEKEQWVGLIKSALANLEREGKLKITVVNHATRKNINRALLTQKPNIVQFIGHGAYKNERGCLCLVDEATGKHKLFSDRQFSDLFLGFDDQLGLIALATCKSGESEDPQGFLGIAPKLLQRGIPAVIAMQYNTSYRAAEIFLEAFYTSIMMRKPVDWAIQNARKALSGELDYDSREFGTPVLYMRAKDGMLF